MYNKITNKPPKDPTHDLLPQPRLNPNNRIYSFAQSNHTSKNDSQNMINFVSGILLLEEAHRICRQVPELLMINCDDINLYNTIVNDTETKKPVKDRINKYLKVIKYVSIGCPEIKEALKFEGNYESHSYEESSEKKNGQNRYTQNKNSDINRYKAILSNNQYGVHGSFKEHTVSDRKKLATSRYVSSKQEQNSLNKHIDQNSKGRLPIFQANSSHNRSTSSSRASQSRSFNKIQLKSVKKLNTKQTGISSKVENKKEEEKNKRYTISRRVETTQNEKALSNQINTLRSSRNSTLVVSRMKNNLADKEETNQYCKASPKNRHRFIQQIPTEMSRLQCQNQINKDSMAQLLGQGSGKTQITKQTVQKSTDFLRMLRMMSQD